jgi:hypothetical protein
MLMTACKTGPDKPDEPEEVVITIPNVNRDSAYAFVEQQVAFGPRVPGTEAHKQCGEWLKSKLEEFGAEVTMQEFKANFHFGTSADAVNIIGSFNPKHPVRVVLAAHWDSRYMAEEDKDDAKKKQPILGADDGASGVGVLLEIARVLKDNPIDLGVDIVFFDAEDQGDNSDDSSGNTTNTWCLGAQHWSRTPHKSGYRASFGILLDMVGSKKARFAKENTSMQFAPTTMNRTWQIAQDMGYGNYFVNEESPGVVDDHYFVNQIARIPMLDIINRPPGGRFGDYWHTHDDNMDIISKRSLGAVGNVVLAVIYNKSIGEF